MMPQNLAVSPQEDSNPRKGDNEPHTAAPATVVSAEANTTEVENISTTAEAKVEPKKLNKAEKQELNTHEETISKGNQTFFEVGAALSAINKSKLYRESYQTFEDYVQKRWLMSRPAAYRYVFAGDVMEVLTPEGGVLPRNESQLRPFSELKVKREEWKETWKYIVKHAKSKPLTAVLITTLIFAKRGKLPGAKKGKKRTAPKVLTEKLKPVLVLVSDARKKVRKGETTGLKALLQKIETKLKALKTLNLAQ